MISQPATAAKGYCNPSYARSLAEFGIPRELPCSGAWVLDRTIPGTIYRDAMGCYPLFCCRDWTVLESDLESMSPLVSIAVVPDPFGNFDHSRLEGCFDRVIPFKDHHVVDFRKPLECSKHHRYYTRAALRHAKIDVYPRPEEFLETWLELYGNLIRRHSLTGIKAFSAQTFKRQLAVPGLIVLTALSDGVVVGAHLWYVQDDVAYSHLAASSDVGYRMSVSYALYDGAIEYFRNKVRWLDFGAGAGVGKGRDGLAIFKAGWSNGVRPVYFCGRIFDHAAYDTLLAQKQISPETAYFPAYRSGELT
jgi:hypothetical protein